MVLVEVASNSVNSAIQAQEGGARRIELCGNLADGGTTPARSQIELTRENVSIDLNVIVRPRGGDFLYNDIEFESMKRDIAVCGETGCNGVVIGILDAMGNVDMDRNRYLVDLAKQMGLSVTFHRAIDRAANIFDAMEDIIALGCDRILTSGGYGNAYDGRDVIKKMVEQAGDRIVIMPGAGVNEDNAAKIVSYTGAREIHGTFQSFFEGKMMYKNPNFTDKSEYSYLLSDARRVRQIVKNVNR